MSVETELLEYGAALDEALIANNAGAIAPYFADEWIAIGPDGPNLTKADLLAWVASGKLAHHSMRTIGEPRIVGYGEVAITTARRASTGAWEGVAYAADEWMTEVYVWRDGAWRCVITQKAPAG